MTLDARPISLRRLPRALLAAGLLATSTVLALVSLALADDEDAGDARAAEGSRRTAMPDDPAQLAQRAIEADPAIAAPAIAALRALGPLGPDALFRAHASDVAALRAGTSSRTDHAPLRRAIDVVSGQRDAHASGLYWHTDLDAALGEARRTGRPILSLRLLGRLDEELSCANSRFFRVVIYPDREVAQLLASRFVLHWSSERPAPRITIDMGDGRRIERTITGNSVHYVIDARGRVVDALPGLYAPAQFVRALERSRTLATACTARDGVAFGACLRERHASALAEDERRWHGRRSPVPLPTWDALLPAALVRSDAGAPGAIEAMPVTIGKARIEMPMLRALARDPSAEAPRDPIAWRAAAAEDVAEERLDAPSLALLALKRGTADLAAEAARIVEAAAIDGVRNEALLHRRVHEWLAADGEIRFSRLNDRVYSELFLTPASDPWLGLMARDLWDLVEIER
jgi:hypothetical protein